MDLHSILLPVFLAAMSAAIGVFFKRISAAMDRHRNAVTALIDNKFEGLAKADYSQDESIAQIKRQLHDIEVRLPEHYVRQIDMQRDMGRLNISIQAMHDKMDKIIMGAALR